VHYDCSGLFVASISQRKECTDFRIPSPCISILLLIRCCSSMCRDFSPSYRLYAPAYASERDRFSPTIVNCQLSILQPLKLFLILLLFLTLNTEGRHWTGLQSFIRNILATLFTDSKNTLVKPVQGPFDF